MTTIEFVSYDGRYPCLCMGTLVIRVNGKTYRLKNALVSGGDVLSNHDFSDMWTVKGEWRVALYDYPELEPYKEEIARVVNENVEYGCCGGCI